MEMHVMQNTLKLYEFPPTRSIRVRWTLQEMQLDFESIPVNLPAHEHHAAEFLRLNPAGKVPVLVDGDLVLIESVAIVLYLADKYPDKGFTPTSVEDRGLMAQWLLFAATELEQPLWRIARHTRLYPAARRIAAEIPNARQDFLEMARVLDAHMQERQFVVGDSACVADFVVAYTLDWADELDLLGPFPRLSAYLESMYDRPRAAPRIADAMQVIKQSQA
jgi:glutathione S-transferase